MPNLQPISAIPPGSSVLLRMDLDVPMKDGIVADSDRLIKSLPTIHALLEKKCVIVVIGHIGRPNGMEEKYSLKPVFAELMSLVQKDTKEALHSMFIEDITDETRFVKAIQENNFVCLENLRYWKGEEENDPQFLKQMTKNVDWYVDDALAVAHRRHRSIMLYKEMRTAYGIAFIDEVHKLMKIVHDPQHPVTVILGGAKKDKLSYVDGLLPIVDHILIGGKLPMLIDATADMKNPKIYIAGLNEKRLDLSDGDMAIFKEVISSSKMIVWAGAMGLFEDPTDRIGTETIARAVVESHAYTVLAGGDTEASVSNLGQEKEIDCIASGGGMMLELLTHGTLPAWE